MRSNLHQINTVLVNMQIHDNPSHELLHVSPPRSGGGSDSGYRVSFGGGVEGPSAYHDGPGVTGSEGYVSWDEEWERNRDPEPHDDTSDYAYADGFENDWMDGPNGTSWPMEETGAKLLQPWEEEDGRSNVGGRHVASDPCIRDARRVFRFVDFSSGTHHVGCKQQGHCVGYITERCNRPQ
jgi:hypothetical protein